MGCDLSVVVFQITEKVGFRIPEAGFRILDSLTWGETAHGRRRCLS